MNQIQNAVYHRAQAELCGECSGCGCHACDQRGCFPVGWYFYSETWTDIYGPYQDAEQAGECCRRYAIEIVGK